MPNTITIPFHAVKLKLSTGGHLSLPLMDTGALRLNDSIQGLSKKFSKLFQDKVLNKGDFLKVMDHYKEGPFQTGTFIIAFPAAKDKISFPEFDLEFQYFFKFDDKGAWGIIPALGIESFSENIEDLKGAVREATRLEFERKKRLNAVQHIISTLWFESHELETEKMLLKIPSPTELDKLEKENKDEILPKVGSKLVSKNQATFGRTKELGLLQSAVKSNFNKNVLLLGNSGVGKSALVWELARQKKKLGIKEEIWETSASILIKELSRDTGWQDNIIYLCQELRNNGDYLFIRSLAELFEVGKYQGNDVSIAEYLRPFIQRGEIKIITESTREEISKIELKSPGYIALFQQIRLETPPKKELEEIIITKTNSIAKTRNISLENEAIQEVIRLNSRFTPYAGFPGKPIRFLESLLVNLSQQKEKLQLSRTEIIQHFCADTGMPSFLIDPEIPMDLKEIKKQFNQNVFGQLKATNEVANVLGTIKTALSRTGKPIASFLFVGPTGVGKTELAKVLAEFTFGSREKMTRFDMSEYSNPWSIGRLLGTNFHEDGLLTAAVRREPFCVLLFDEIEKASPKFYDLLLQILGEGRLTDSRGRLVNFCSTIIIMTSNIGSSQFQTGRIGWNKDLEAQEVVHHFQKAVESHFRPELFNRIDQIIPFEPLTKESVRFVVDREINILKKREGIRFRNLDLKIADAVLDYLAIEGYDAKYGARQLQRTIREKLIIPLSKELNAYDFSDRLLTTVIVDNQKIVIHIEADPLGFDLLLEQWDKLNFADQASDYRRKIDQLKEGPTMVRFYNEFDYLKNQKKQLGEKFWKERARSESYSHFLQIIESTTQLYNNIDQLEMNISLACLDLATYEADFENQIQAWGHDFFELKKQIYYRLHPSANTCHLAIYGNHFEAILELYISIIEEKEFQFKANTLWFNENNLIQIFNEPPEEEPGELTILKKAINEYKKKPWSGKFEELSNEESKEDILCGIELIIEGDCPYLFLKGEEGFQKWNNGTHEELTFYVQVENTQITPPENIHRQSFYKNRTARRVIDAGSVIDSILKIYRELPRNGLKDYLIDTLERLFENVIEAEVA